MTTAAKDVYHAYHVALGTTNAPAFERIPVAEQEAWSAVAEAARSNDCYTGHIEIQLQIARCEFRQQQTELADLKVLLEQITKLAAARRRKTTTI